MAQDSGNGNGDARVWKILGPIGMAILMAAGGLIVRNNSQQIDDHTLRIKSLEDSRVHDIVKLTEIEVNTKNTASALPDIKAELKNDINEVKRSLDSLHDHLNSTPVMPCRGAGCPK